MIEKLKSEIESVFVSLDGKYINFPCEAIKSSKPEVINLDGNVYPTDKKEAVTITYMLPNGEEYEKIYTIYSREEIEAISHFLDKKYGLFVHYVWSGKRHKDKGITGRTPNGVEAQSVNEMIENFDVKQFADDCEAFGLQYVIFTAWHYAMHPLYPSEVFKKWRVEKEDNPTVDLIERIYDELNARNIDLLIYSHPYDIHDLYEEDQLKFDYKHYADADFDYKLWNDYLNETYKELCERYKGRVKGFFFDEGIPELSNSRGVDYDRLRNTVKSIDPSYIMIQNFYGSKFTCDTAMKEDMLQWHGAMIDDLNTWQTYEMSYGARVGKTPFAWWATYNRGDKDDMNIAKAEDLYRFTVMEAGINNQGGGTAYAMGPYMGLNDVTGGDIWEDGIRDLFIKINEYMEPIEKSIKNTIPSRSYPTRMSVKFPELEWGVATETLDGKTTYLHILKSPEGKTLEIGKPKDSKEFVKAYLLDGNISVDICKCDEEIAITIPDDMEWNELNTVIALEA